MHRSILLLLTLFLGGCMADALAEQNVTSLASSTREERQGSAAQQLGGVFATAGNVFGALDASGDEIAFPNGSQVVVSCTTQQFVCWLMIDSAEITSMTLATMAVVDAEGNDGRAPCARVEAGTYRTMVLDRNVFLDAGTVGRRVSSCDGATHSGRPCRTGVDSCPGASTCALDGFGTITKAMLYASANTCAWSLE